MDDVSARLAVRLKALRLARGLTQAALANHASVTAETIARLERVVRHRPSANANPSLDTLVRIATALQVDIAELLSPVAPSEPGLASPRRQGGEGRRSEPNPRAASSDPRLASIAALLKDAGPEVYRRFVRVAEALAPERPKTPARKPRRGPR